MEDGKGRAGGSAPPGEEDVEDGRSDAKVVDRAAEETEPLVGSGEMADCRICHEEEEIARMEAPCLCSGSVKYAHRPCIQRWCDEKGNIKCEICGQDYRNFSAVERRAQPDGEPVPLENLPPEIREQIQQRFLAHLASLQDPRMRAASVAHGVTFLDVEDDYETVALSSGGWFRAALLVMLSLLLLRHAFSFSDGDPEIPIVSLVVLRVAAILLPCYIVLRVLSLLHAHRQQSQQEHLLGNSGTSSRLADILRTHVVSIANSPARPDAANAVVPPDAPVAQNRV